MRQEEEKIRQNISGQEGFLLSVSTLTLIIVDLAPVTVDTIVQIN